MDNKIMSDQKFKRGEIESDLEMTLEEIETFEQDLLRAVKNKDRMAHYVASAKIRGRRQLVEHLESLLKTTNP